MVKISQFSWLIIKIKKFSTRKRFRTLKVTRITFEPLEFTYF